MEMKRARRIARARAYDAHDPDRSKSLEYAAYTEEVGRGWVDPLDGELCSEDEWKASGGQEIEEVDSTFSFS